MVVDCPAEAESAVGTRTSMAVLGLSHSLIFCETQRVILKGSLPKFSVELTFRFVAVLKELMALSVKYHILFVPPVALNTMVFPEHMAEGVPAFKGAAGISNACALVPAEAKLSQPNFIQVALYNMGVFVN